jgi:uncharacterized repeat protein (TIGR03803 family)
MRCTTRLAMLLTLGFVLGLGVLEAQTFTVLHSFSGGTDGIGPSNLIRDSKGNLYGTTNLGGGTGCSGYGCGVVFKLDTSAIETILYNFVNGSNVSAPTGLVRDAKGNLYGTTGWGGLSDWGAVFELNTSGNETLLYSFLGGSDGGYPIGLVRDKVGNLYGTEAGCDGYGYCPGSVFKVDTEGTKTALYSFTGGTDGFGPGTGVVRDKVGNIYATTMYGGNLATCTNNIDVMYPPNGCGTVFKLDTSGNEAVLYDFTGNGGDGVFYPDEDLIRDAKGNLYGVASSSGSVFKLSMIGKLTVFHTFAGGTDGADPEGPLVRGGGNLYGATKSGGGSGCGGYGCGIVYELTKGKLTVLYIFTGGSDGAYPTGPLALDTDGTLYGTTVAGGDLNCNGPYGYGCGVVFKLHP